MNETGTKSRTLTGSSLGSEAGSFSAPFDKVDQSESNVPGVPGKRSGGHLTGFVGVFGFSGTSAEVAQDPHTAFGENLLSDFVDGGQNSPDAARRRLVRYGTVANGEMSFFDEAVAIDLEKDVFHPGGRPTFQRRLHQRLENGKDFGPAFAERFSQ